MARIRGHSIVEIADLKLKISFLIFSFLHLFPTNFSFTCVCGLWDSHAETKATNNMTVDIWMEHVNNLSFLSSYNIWMENLKKIITTLVQKIRHFEFTGKQISRKDSKLEQLCCLSNDALVLVEHLVVNLQKIKT